MHYTLFSGVRTTCVSSRCPVCLTPKQWPASKVKATQLFLDELCCSEACSQQWRSRLLALCEIADPSWFIWYTENVEAAVPTTEMASYIDSILLKPPA